MVTRVPACPNNGVTASIAGAPAGTTSTSSVVAVSRSGALMSMATQPADVARTVTSTAVADGMTMDAGKETAPGPRDVSVTVCGAATDGANDTRTVSASPSARTIDAGCTPSVVASTTSMRACAKTP